jgi:Uma2 family endonuclease
MAAPPVEARYKPEDLLSMEGEGRFELVDGRLVEKPMGAESSCIGFNIMFLVRHKVSTPAPGLFFGSNCGYQIVQDDPERVRYPDGSFIRRGRLPNDKPPKGHIRIAPDIALEVVSPNDGADDVQIKIDEYLQAGVRLVWLVYPSTRQIHVYRPDGSISRLTTTDDITGEDVLPEFVCRVEDLFAAI